MLSNIRLSRMIPWMTLGLGLLATYGSWKLVDGVIDEREDLRFAHEVDGLTEDILSHLKAYDVIMRGTAALFLASDTVSRAEFRDYYETLRLTESYSGFLNLGYAEALASDEIEAHAAWMRGEGFPDFTIHPDVPGDEHAIVTLIEPFDGVNEPTLGFDGVSTPSGAAAMRRARDTGRASLSAHTPLLRNREGLNASVIMFLPVYENGKDPGTVATRREALKGYVFGGLRLNELMAELQSPSDPLINLAVYDVSNGGQQTQLFDQQRDGESARANELTRTIEFGGRDWTLRFTESPGFRQSTPIEPKMAAIAGVIFSLILFVLTLFLERLEQERRRNAEALLSTEKKLRQSQKMEAIGQLTGGVAHDFNNLLQVILGNAELMVEQSEPNSSQRRLAELTQKAAERGAELTNRLLAFARRQALKPKPTDVNGLLAGMETLVHRALGETVETELVRDPELMPALVDPAQLESAVLNLCINARDAMPEGGTLSIETLNVTLDAKDTDEFSDLTPGDYARITVRDTGCGMDQATLAQAFEPFFTTKEVGKGSGLGLSMVFGFVKQSNGHVKIESRPGQGTTVKLYLPTCPERDLDKTPSPDGEDARGNSELRLLVEDNAMVRANMADQLRPPLFTDLVMPGVLGAKRVDKNPYSP